MKKCIYLILLFISPVAWLAGQTTTGELRITVKDADGPVEFAAVGVLQDGSMVNSASTDSAGRVTFKPVNAGTYDIKVHRVGYATTTTKDIKVGADRPTFLTVTLNLEEGDIEYVVRPRPKLIEPFKISNEIENPGSAAGRGNMVTLANQTPGVVAQDGGGLSIGGNRGNTHRIYWNGVPINGNNISGFSASAVQSMEVLIGGISAEYGDFLGGALIFNTPRPGLFRRTSIEGISSSLFDKYNNNYAEFFSMGPLLIKNKGRDSAKVKLGYMFSGNYQHQADRTPSAIGVWRVKPDMLKELEATPIRASAKGQGYVPSAEFITQNDLEKVTYHQNVPSTNVSTVGELNYAPNDRFQVLAGGKYDYNNSINYNFNNNLFNFSNNSQSISHNLLTYLSFTHTLKQAGKEDDGMIKNAYYNIRLSYEAGWSVTQDAVHGDNFFDYGYIGRFKTYSAPAFEFRGQSESGNPDTVVVNGQTYYLKNYYRQTGNRMVDTLVTFDRSNTRNPIRANYTSAYYALVGQQNINSLTEIRGSGAGLVNGQNPIGIYSNMWNNVGLGVQGYGKSQNQQVGINATGQITTANHEVRFGIYHEQRTQRAWSVRANDLWFLMGQLANNGLELDQNNPILVTDENGVFRDTVRYGYRQNAAQSEFDKRLRAKLMAQGAVDNNGYPIGANSFIDVNSFDPTDFSLSLFSADELLNNGNNYVSYYGYDYMGNKTNGRTGTASFTNDALNRNVGAYMPTYSALFAQDKISFKNFSLRVGARLERFDNNMPVLKDPYLLYSARTAGEVKTMNGAGVTHPDNIGNDYVVYVDDARNPGKITGYRHGNTWYNAQGLQVADPAVIAEKSTGSTIQPYLSNAGQQRVSPDAFTDYKPTILVLPRLYFDFPIKEDVARFFASYDVLAQRPTNNFATIADYYYLPYNSTNIIGNPDLKPQRTTNYEVGFNLKIADRSALALTAAYREQRNLIQLYKYNYAYPISYTSFANIDFATIKSFTAQYIYKDFGMVMDASYTLQFADGTGSSAGSQQALIAVGQPNLRTLFPLSFDVRNNIKFNISYSFGNGEEYKGPVLGKKHRVLENAGIVMNLNAFSGLPYTSNLLPTPDAQSGIPTRSPIKGTPFGARLPWQLQNDVSLFKSVAVKLGRSKSGVKMGELKFSLWVNNFMNIKNIRAIHAYTGSAATDGWLNSEKGRQAIESAQSAQAFTDLYNIALTNPGYYTMPRRVRLGVSLSF